MVREEPFEILPLGDEGEQEHATAGARTHQRPVDGAEVATSNSVFPNLDSYNFLCVGAISSIDPAAP